MKLSVILALVLAALALPATASAAPFTPELEADYAGALAWWGVSSPPQCASVTRELLPSDPLGEGAAARATQPQPGESGVACVVQVFEDAESTGCIEEMDLRHEVGHLLGLGHSEDPTSIMHPPPDFSLWCPAQVAAEKEDRRKELEDESWRYRGMTAHCRALKHHGVSQHRMRYCWEQLRETREVLG